MPMAYCLICMLRQYAMCLCGVDGWWSVTAVAMDGLSGKRRMWWQTGDTGAAWLLSGAYRGAGQQVAEAHAFLGGCNYLT